MTSRRTDLVESMAIAGAFACLVHCIALPVLIAMLPALATIAPSSVAVHIALLLFAVPTTLLALGAGYRRHGAPPALLLGGVGLGLLTLGVLVYGDTRGEVPLTVAGSVAITFAHIANWAARRRATR